MHGGVLTARQVRESASGFSFGNSSAEARHGVARQPNFAPSWLGYSEDLTMLMNRLDPPLAISNDEGPTCNSKALLRTDHNRNPDATVFNTTHLLPSWITTTGM